MPKSKSKKCGKRLERDDVLSLFDDSEQPDFSGFSSDEGETLLASAYIPKTPTVASKVIKVTHNDKNKGTPITEIASGSKTNSVEHEVEKTRSKTCSENTAKNLIDMDSLSVDDISRLRSVLGLQTVSTQDTQWKRSLTEVDMKRRKAAEKERSRLQLKIIDKIANPTVGFELEQFKLFGNLNKGCTEVHNTVPTLMTVDAERDCIAFEKHRKRRPHDVSYHHFYECIMEEAHKPPTPSLRTSMSGVSLRTPVSNTNMLTPRSVTKTPVSDVRTPKFGLLNS